MASRPSNPEPQGFRELALFAGAGGGILGGKLLGWQTVCAVEINPYCRAVLAQRQNDKALPPFPIWDDVCTFDGRPWRGLVDVVSGGFPCQDISVAGRGEGITGARSGLWKQMARIIGEVRPRHVLIENSPALRTRGLEVVLGDLAAMGYDASWGVLGAVHASAPHRRNRIWVLANSDSSRRLEQRRPISNEKEFPLAECDDWWAIEPRLGRVAHGVAHRVDRIRAIGNGQVPQVAALAYRLLS